MSMILSTFGVPLALESEPNQEDPPGEERKFDSGSADRNGIDSASDAARVGGAVMTGSRSERP